MQDFFVLQSWIFAVILYIFKAIRKKTAKDRVFQVTKQVCYMNLLEQYYERCIYMRLDKYLKVTRLIKRRTVANDACDAEKISVNGKIARASYDVKVGDIIEINMGVRPLKVKVLNVTEYATKENAADNYTVIE